MYVCELLYQSLILFIRLARKLRCWPNDFQRLDEWNLRMHDVQQRLLHVWRRLQCMFVRDSQPCHSRALGIIPNCVTANKTSDGSSNNATCACTLCNSGFYAGPYGNSVAAVMAYPGSSISAVWPPGGTQSPAAGAICAKCSAKSLLLLSVLCKAIQLTSARLRLDWQRDNCAYPPILQLANIFWNNGEHMSLFSMHQWLYILRHRPKSLSSLFVARHNFSTLF